MSHRALQRIISVAVTDPEFCDELLNGRRYALLTEFDLTDEERRVLTTIEAISLQEFAIRLEEWLQTQENGKGSTAVRCSSRDIPQHYGWPSAECC